MKMLNHTIHKYRRHLNKKTNTVIYKCDLINCTHYVPEHLVWNRITICHNCGENFVMTKRKNVQMKPKCLNCTGRKDEEFDNLIKNLELPKV